MTSYIQLALEKSIAGEWNGYTRFTDSKAEAARLIAPNDDMVALIMLAPDFWRALGKSEGWKKTETRNKNENKHEK